MNRIFSFALATATAAWVLHTAQLQATPATVETDPTGFVVIPCKIGSDTLLSVPFAHATTFVGKTGGGAIVKEGDLAMIQSAHFPAWIEDQFADLYYVKFTSGALNGHYFTITANTTNSLTFDTLGDSAIAALQAGDRFSIVKYWTLGELFPPATQTAIQVSAGSLAFLRRSTLLFPDNIGVGINKAFNQSFFLIAAGWRKDATGSPAADNQILYPDSAFIVRHQPGTGTDTTFVAQGSVNIDPAVTAIPTATDKFDTCLGLQRPIGVTLEDSGLESAFMVSVNNLAFNRRDVLMVFDNSVALTNKAASRSFYKVGANWIEDAPGNPNANTFILEAGSGFLIRKYQTSDGATSFWNNSPNY